MVTKTFLALSVFILAGIYSWLTKRMQLYSKAARSMALIESHMHRLDRWQKLRPFIHRGYCGYARFLILEMIEAYEFLLKNNYENDREMLYTLRRLLLEFPPDYDPPLAGGSFLTSVKIELHQKKKRGTKRC